MVGSLGQGIKLAIAGPFAVEDGVIVGSKGGCPPGMAAGGRLGCAEVLQVFMICENADRMSSSLHIHPPLLKCLYHSQ